MSLPSPGERYSMVDESETRRLIDGALARCRKKLEDVEMGANSLILTAPDGTRWRVTVDNDGDLGTTGI